MKLALRIFFIFSLGYFISYLVRGINLPLGPLLSREIGLSPAQLGLLTSFYFFAFAGCQLPLGILLDRFGPRKVLASLLAVAALGALLSASAHSFGMLLLGRFFLGVGTSACMMAGLKAIIAWFHRDQLPIMNGALYAIGGLGAMMTGIPVSWAMGVTSWRMLFVIVAAMTGMVILALIFFVPEKDEKHPKSTLSSQLRDVAKIFRSAIFLRTAPLALISQGVFLGVQGLWAGPYLRDVSQLNPAQAANIVTVVGFAMVLGAAGFGWLARRLEREGITIHTTAGAGMLLFMAAQLLIMLDTPLPLWLLWGLYGISGTAGVLTFASMTKEFHGYLAGRVSTGLTFIMFIGAFIVQYGFGLLLNAWPHDNGSYAVSAHQASWSIALVLQACALIWFCRKLPVAEAPVPVQI
ncbi:MFS transporter [Glaciimonas immobilis]|uniref:Putative MFS family arabinose efflux permease n=1 Tax=Glaciimonas immobilis TaxID=728004 RepID=A0A840RSW3_9BURK|nr:MFS transporter [Glaciimonas immobilis]KAF3999782.1 MFS transporter [Glaciimonas immobilis]MBB5200252.1 putative MFS family arabinose efflux permease [Glaciimonas immobilis]